MKPTQVLNSTAPMEHRPSTTRLLAVLVGLVVLAGVLAKGQGAGAQAPGITSPRDNAVVVGTVAIQGTATHPEFWKYELYYSPMATEEWVFIGQVHETSVINGQLEIWYTTTVPDGAYKLRLRVVRRDGNYDEYFVRNISVSNTVPTVTPTSETPPTRAPTPIPLPPTPTIVVEQPKLPTPTPQPTVNEPAVPEKKVETEADHSPPSALSIEGLSNAACYGGASAGGLFLLVVILALLRRLVSLLLSRL